MRRQFVKGLTMLMLIIALAFVSAVATANAQSSGNLIAQVPFDFIVGDKTLASGEYTVRSIGNAGDAVAIKNSDVKDHSALRLTGRTGKQSNDTQARLIFHRYGDRYFLSQVWMSGDSVGRELLKSRQERAIQRELKAVASSDQNKRSYEVVEIVAEVR